MTIVLILAAMGQGRHRKKKNCHNQKQLHVNTAGYVAFFQWSGGFMGDEGRLCRKVMRLSLWLGCASAKEKIIRTYCDMRISLVVGRLRRWTIEGLQPNKRFEEWYKSTKQEVRGVVQVGGFFFIFLGCWSQGQIIQNYPFSC